MKIDRKEMDSIGLSLSDENLEHLRDSTTVKDMWDTSLNVFVRNTLLNELFA